MKRLMMTILMFSMLVPATGWSDKGREGGNGGDTIANSFKSEAQKIVVRMRDLGAHLFPEVDLDDLQYAIDNVTVRTKRVVRLRGRQVEAKNYPSKNLIVVSRKAYKEMDKSEWTKLAVHEYLGIIGSERNHYDVTNKIFKTFSDPLLAHEGKTVSSCTYTATATLYPDAMWACQDGKNRSSDGPVLNKTLTRTNDIREGDNFERFLFANSQTTDRFTYTWNEEKDEKLLKAFEAKLEERRSFIYLTTNISRDQRVYRVQRSDHTGSWSSSPAWAMTKEEDKTTYTASVPVSDMVLISNSCGYLIRYQVQMVCK